MKKHRQKLQGGTQAMTKLKTKWRGLSDDVRAGWLELLISEMPRTEIRERIRQEWGIDLQFNQQISVFRFWAEDEEQHLVLATKIEERKKELLKGGMTLEEAQQVLLKDAAIHSVASKNFKLGLRTSSEITRLQNTMLSRDKFLFRAIVHCRKNLPALKEIEADISLTEDEKTQRFTEILFGVNPMNPPQLPHASPPQQN